MTTKHDEPASVAIRALVRHLRRLAETPEETGFYHDAANHVQQWWNERMARKGKGHPMTDHADARSNPLGAASRNARARLKTFLSSSARKPRPDAEADAT